MYMSTLITPGVDKVYSCRYKVGAIAFMLDDDELILDYTNIVSIEKIDNYESFIRSRIKLTVRLDIRQKIWIIKHKKDIICKFELMKTGMDQDGETFVNGYESCWNEDFCIYLNDDDASIDTELLEGSLSSNGEDNFKSDDIQTTNYFESDNVLELNLFNQYYMDSSNKQVNRVFTSDVLQNVVGELLTETKHYNVLISKVENDTVYEELLIPKMKLYQALLYLDQSFGLYKKGAIVYYDVDKAYLINSCSKVTAAEDKEWTQCTFLVSNFSGVVPGGAMVRKPEEEKYYIMSEESAVFPTKPSLENNEKLGSIVNVITTDDLDIETIKGETEVISQANEFNVFIHKDDNQFFSTIAKARIEENDSVIYVNLINADITAFAVNKRYNFVFEDATKQAKYGKFKYRIIFGYHLIYTESPEYMSSSHKLIFKKCASND